MVRIYTIYKFKQNRTKSFTLKLVRIIASLYLDYMSHNPKRTFAKKIFGVN